jgi:type IV pilus assembly protein PilC
MRWPRRDILRIRPRVLTDLTRQLAALLGSGVDLLTAMSLLMKSTPDHHCQHWLENLHVQLSRGITLGAALQRHPRIVDAFYRRLVVLGEASGQLPKMLIRIADARDEQARRRLALHRALRYPIFVCCVAFGLIVALMHWAIPAFEPLFSSFGTELPPLTRAVLSASRHLPRYGIGVGAVCLTGVLLSRLPALRQRWRYRWRVRWQARTLRLPVLGPALRQIALGQWALGMATLLGAGVPLAHALQVLSSGGGHAVFDAASTRLARRLAQGASLSEAMRDCPCFPDSAIHIVAMAEHCGTLEAMLADLGQRCAQGGQERLDALMQWVEPLVICVSGGFVAILVISLYMPIIELGNVV